MSADEGLSALRLGVRSEPSPLFRCTGGLSELFDRLRSGKAAGAGRDLVFGRYRVGARIGSGEFSDVHEAEDAASPAEGARFSRVALKIVHAKFLQLAVHEVRLMQRLRVLETHGIRTCCVPLRSAFFHDGKLHLATELRGPNMVHRKVPRELLPAVACRLLTAIAAVHRAGGIHADVKPENVLLPREGFGGVERLCLADFGSWIVQQDVDQYYGTGQDDFDVQSLFYRAPEVLVGLDFGPPIDVWSVACVLFELASGGEPLFVSDGPASALDAVVAVTGPLSPSVFGAGRLVPVRRVWPLLAPASEDGARLLAAGLAHRRRILRSRLPDRDPEFVEFLAQLLEPDPLMRPTASKALSLPFVRDVDESVAADGPVGASSSAARSGRHRGQFVARVVFPPSRRRAGSSGDLGSRSGQRSALPGGPGGSRGDESESDTGSEDADSPKGRGAAWPHADATRKKPSPKSRSKPSVAQRDGGAESGTLMRSGLAGGGGGRGVASGESGGNYSERTPARRLAGTEANAKGDGEAGAAPPSSLSSLKRPREESLRASPQNQPRRPRPYDRDAAATSREIQDDRGGAQRESLLSLTTPPPPSSLSGLKDVLKAQRGSKSQPLPDRKRPALAAAPPSSLASLRF